MKESREWNRDKVGWDVVGPCWNCGATIRYFIDEDGTPRDIEPEPCVPQDETPLTDMGRYDMVEGS